MKSTNFIIAMLLIVLSSTSEANKEPQNITPEKITSTHTALTKECTGLEVTLRLWHEETTYNKELWHKLTHIFLDLSLMYDMQNPKSLNPFFSGEPYQTILNSNSEENNGIFSGLEIKGDYTNAISFNLFSIPITKCYCLKSYSPNCPIVKCTCKRFQRIKDGATIFYDDTRWQHIVSTFISYMKKMYTPVAYEPITIARLLENIDPRLKEAVLQINNDSGIHGFFKTSMYDHEAEISLGFVLQENDSLTDKDIFKSAKILNLDCSQPHIYTDL